MSSFEDITKWGRPEPSELVPTSFPDGRTGFDLLDQNHDPITGEVIIHTTQVLDKAVMDYTLESLRSPYFISTDGNGNRVYVPKTWVNPFLIGLYSQSRSRDIGQMYPAALDHPDVCIFQATYHC